MLPQNAYLLAKIGADTAENEQHFAEILPTDAPGCTFGHRRGAHGGVEVDAVEGLAAVGALPLARGEGRGGRGPRSAGATDCCTAPN